MLKHGILGLLHYGDMTGYEIRTVFKDSLNFFWSAQTSQIYRELDVLEKKGWIEKREMEQDGRPNKNICSITEAGRRELLRWLADGNVSATKDHRDPVLMKTFFMGELPASDGLDFFRRLRAECEERLKGLQQTDTFIRMYQEMVPDKKQAVFWGMTAEFGKRYMKMYLDWAQSCIDVMEGMQ